MELLQRRKFCREFLNGYNEKLHPQIISKVFEIGLLLLKKKYNKLLFSKEELDEIIKDLSGKDYVEIVPLPPLKKLNKLQNPPEKPFQPNDDYYLNTENRDTDLLKNKIFKNKPLYYNTLKNPNFTTQNSAIYPNWWWNNKEEEEEIEKPNNKINIIYNDDINNNYENNNDDNYNYEYEENEDNGDHGDYIHINEGRENEMDYQEIENDENSKNYTIKKLTMNSGRPKRSNRYENNNNFENLDEEIYYDKPNKIPFNPKNMKSLKNAKKIPIQIKKKEVKQRVKSSKPPQRKINSFTKNPQPIKNKVIKKAPNISQGKKDVKLIKIPNYKYTYVNGRILRIPDANKKFMNLTTTEPNKY